MNQGQIEVVHWIYYFKDDFKVWSGRIRGLQDWWNSLKVLHLTKYVLQARISSRDVPIEMIS